MTRVDCQYFPECSGCQYIGEDIDIQREKKVQDLQKHISAFTRNSLLDIQWVSPGIFGLRDRLDFIWEDSRLGLYSSEKKQIIDLQQCGQLSPELTKWHQEFRQIKWPIKKGSLRLRVGPTGLKGVWLDFANEDIKMLLEEKKILENLLSKSIVEIGQKRKLLVATDKGLKLKDPEPHLWFESLFRNQKVSIFSYVGSFTQPSLKANQSLLSVISSWVESSGYKRASEFGSGIGNLSFTLLGWVDELHVYENDALSTTAFQKTLATYQEKFSQKKIHFHVGDYHARKAIQFSSEEVLMVNPPRAGLKDFLKTLEGSKERPQCLIYMSCFPESWAQDGAVLQQLGYRLDKVSILDQFPQTAHYEILSMWLL